uniref:Membrane cofactor protein n=1 Tax=Catagonus wagneri TaxID=51154 RepID=A0A8C3WNX4_9CETA
MMAFCAVRKALPCRPESPFSSRCRVGILSVALVLLLPVSSDTCGEPPRFESMMLQGALKPSYSPGDLVEYECRLGFQPIVPALPTSSVCLDNNTWSSLQEACKRRACTTLADPSNGQVNYLNGDTLYGSQAKYTCNTGFYIIGEDVVRCEASENGVAWSDPPPICEKILCKPPGEIANGRHTNSHKDVFEYGEVVTYSCLPSTGQDEFSLVGESSLFCVGKDKWSSDPPECKVVKCVFPVVSDGTIESGFGTKFYYKAEVTFKCNEGFTLHGSNTVTCGANSMWEPELPKCIKDSKPTHPPTAPGSSSPGRPSPSDESPPQDAESLGGGIITAIVLAVIAGVIVVGGALYCFLSKSKKGLK